MYFAPRGFACIAHHLLKVEMADCGDKPRRVNFARQHGLADINIVRMARETVRDACQAMNDVGHICRVSRPMGMDMLNTFGFHHPRERDSFGESQQVTDEEMPAAPEFAERQHQQ